MAMPAVPAGTAGRVGRAAVGPVPPSFRRCAATTPRQHAATVYYP